MGSKLSQAEENALSQFCGSAELAKKLVQAGRPVPIAKDTVFIEEATVSNDVYFILSGSARAFLLSIEGREMWLATYGPGHLIGEIAALTNTPRTASIIATNAVNCLKIDATTFKDLMHANGALGLIVATLLADRLAQTTATLFSAAIDQIDKRILKHLLKADQRLADQRLADQRLAENSRVEISPIPVISELALELGSNRETVSRAINKLIRLGVIVRRPTSLLVLPAAD